MTPALPVGPARRAEMLVRLARESLSVHPEEAAQLALRALERARAEHDERGTAHAMLVLAQACYAAGHDPSEIFAPINVAIEGLQNTDDYYGLAEAKLLQANLLFDRCILDESAVAAQEALDSAERAGAGALAAEALLRLATIFCDLTMGGQSEYRKYFEEAANRFIELGDNARAATALYNLAVSSFLLKADPELAYRDSQRVLDLEQGRSTPQTTSAFILRAVVASRLGWVEIAEKELACAEAGAALLPVAGNVQLELSFARGVVYQTSGRLIEAQHELANGADRCLAAGDAFRAIDCYRELSTVRELRGDYAGALAAARAHHATYVSVQAGDKERRRQAVIRSAQFELNRREILALQASRQQLEVVVEDARLGLARAEQMLEWERSRRALVELRAHRAPGSETLTGLPDLPTIGQRVNALLAQCAELAIVVITIDHDRIVAPLPDLRQVLVQEMAARTYAFVRSIPGAFAGSIGSEDLVAVIPLTDASAKDTIARQMAQLHGLLVRPLTLDGHSTCVDAQFGVVLAPQDGIRPNGLLSRARLAAQSAQSSRPTGPVVAFFEPGVEAQQKLRNFVRERLPIALSERRLKVVFQPIVDGTTYEVQSAEALVRWDEPGHGPISPVDFIPYAEESELIVELGGYVLREACGEATRWPKSHGKELTVSVNVAAAQLVDEMLIRQVDAALLVSGLDPRRLVLELTETSIARATDALGVIETLRARGIKFEIDDFGTGYSSFSYLSKLPVDGVKIDKSFIDRIATNSDDAAITKAIIAMAHSLRLFVVAEGVEYDEQAIVLRAQGCDALQGYLFSRPLAADDLVAFLSARVSVDVSG